MTSDSDVVEPSATPNNVDDVNEDKLDTIDNDIPDKDNIQIEEEHEKGEAGDPADVVAEPAKKKKKKKKSKNKSGKTNPRPTGFEDNYTEAPLTVQEYEEDLKLYDAKKPFAERIEICIQKYKARRKFDADRNQLFEGYLSLGGIKTGQKKFSGGLDIKPNDDRDAEEIARFTATDYVDSKLSKVGEITGLSDDDEEDAEDEQFIVDFNYVVRGFLSYRVPFVYCLGKPETLSTAVKTIKNFLNFVIYHKVCPEFTESVKEAIATCDIAARELPLCACVSARLPGTFNTACSTLFGGFYQHLLPTEQTWDDVKPLKTDLALTKESVTKTFVNGLAQFGTTSQIEASTNTKVVYKEFTSLQVTRVEFPPEGSKIDALGKLHVNVWTPEGEKPFESKWTDTEGFHLVLEKQILQYCFVGMCFNSTVRELDNGIIFFDEVTGVVTSFFLELQEEKEEDVDSEDFDFD